MIELGRSEEVILEMDRLASEDHSHIATEEEIDVYRGNWWIRSNLVIPTRCRQGIDLTSRKRCRHCTASRKRRTMRTMKIGRTVPPHGGNGKHPGGILPLRHHHDDGLDTDRTVKLVQSVNRLFICGMNLTKIWCTIDRDYIGNSQRSSPSPTGRCKEYISRYRKSRQKWLRILTQQQELHHDRCGQQ